MGGIIYCGEIYSAIAMDGGGSLEAERCLLLVEWRKGMSRRPNRAEGFCSFSDLVPRAEGHPGALLSEGPEGTRTVAFGVLIVWLCAQWLWAATVLNWGEGVKAGSDDGDAGTLQDLRVVPAPPAWEPVKTRLDPREEQSHSLVVKLWNPHLNTFSG